MGTSNYSDEFKRDAVHQITVRGYPVREVSRRLGVSTYSLYKWLKLFGDLRVSRDRGHRFHLIVGTHFTGSRAPISRHLGQ